ncbi:MAG TPA: prepilin-type N-terminal cleavage/methylation domain-containing protein [Stellaceae bacterium]|jgi:general secretion pathway protein J
MTARVSLHRDAAGFTLVELLVAITLIALLTVGLYQAFGIGTRAAGAIGENIDRSAQIALTYDFMERAFSAAEPLPTATDSSSDTTIDFDGESQALSFVAVPPAYLAIGGFQRLRLGLEPGKNGSRLIVTWTGIARGSAVPQATMLLPSILIDQLRSVAFAYFGVAGPQQKAAWLDRWSERNALPQLIRLRLTFANGMHAPDLIVAPRLAETAQP